MSHNDYVYRRTIKKKVTLESIGIHSGKHCSILMKPANGIGIVFNLKKHSCNNSFIKLLPGNITNTTNQLSLGRDTYNVLLIEHIISALHGLGITDCMIETKSVEIPGMDGSSYNFVEAIKSAGIRKLRHQKQKISVPYPIWVVDNERYVIMLPSDDFSVNCTFSSPYPSIGTQNYSSSINPEIYIKEISKARTFGFIEDYEKLQKRGICLGSSFKNSLALSREKVLSSELRYENEVVRHKTLDILGDIYLLGCPINGRLIAYNNNHKLDYELVLKLLNIIYSKEPTKDMIKEQYKKFEVIATKMKNLIL